MSFRAAIIWVLALVGLAVGPRASAVLPAWPPSAEELVQPPVVGSGKDWMMLNTGEWLNGELKRLRTGDITFDSDKLGVATYDFADVRVLWVPRNASWVLHHDTLDGPGVLAEDNLLVDDLVKGPTTAYRGDLGGIVSIGGRERHNWSIGVKVGLDSRWGNSRQLTLSNGLEVSRETPHLLAKLTYDGSVGTTRGVSSVNTHSADLSFKWFSGPIFYLLPLGYSLYSDTFQNIRFRTNPRAGVGLATVRRRYRFGGDVGFTGFYTRYASVEAGDDLEFFGLGPYIGLDGSVDLTSDLTFKAEWSSTIVVNDLGQTFHAGQVTLELDFTDNLSVDLEATLNRTEDPPPLSDGTEVLSDDWQLLAHLKWSW